MQPPTFKCGVCGGDTIVEPQEGPAVCPEHCEDHDYKYESGEGQRCKHCGQQPPASWYDE